MDQDLLFAGVEGQAAAVAGGGVSAIDLTEACLTRIAKVDPALNAFTLVMAEEARAEARRRDASLAAGEKPGPLHGVPVAIKEENDVAGTVTTQGGAANTTPAESDGEVTRLLREAGAVVIGRTNMPEFGQYPFTESDRFGITRNPWHTEHTPGGSSGGTAVAVATGMVQAGIGGDGGGSIRVPSACCGLFGLKPTRGRVSTAPQPDLWGALGTIGPLTRSVVDSAILYDVIQGATDRDRWRLDERPSFTEAARLTTADSQPPLSIGFSTQPVTKGIRPHPDNVAAVHETVGLLRGLGHEVFEMAPRYPDTTAAFLPQFFGAVHDEARRVEHPQLLERRTKQAMAMGRWARPGVVRRAERQGERLAEVVDHRIFSMCDVLLTPTLSGRPPKVGQIEGRSAVHALLRALPMISYLALWNVTGHPAASVPSGHADDGLPRAVQIVAKRGAETTLLALAAQMEAARPWADHRPPV